MTIERLQFTDVGPIAEIAINFDRQLNVFTGPNNTGKSTILWVLSELLVYPFAAPSRSFRRDKPKWALSVASPDGNIELRGTLKADADELLPVYEVIGPAIYVPAHRFGTNFRSSGPKTSQDPEARADEEFRVLYPEYPHFLKLLGEEGLKTLFRQSMHEESASELERRRKLMLVGPSLASDSAVKQKIIDLDYAASRLNKPEIKELIQKIALVARDLTEGFVIKFDRVDEDEGGLFPRFVTQDGSLSQDVLSQGTLSIIHILAHIVFGIAEYYDFPADLEDKPGILIVDEIDAHLHPSWQRRIIPTLIKHFPKIQIICSTHSSLVMAGLKPGQMHLLRRDGRGMITVTQNETDLLGWSSDEILQHLMEVINPTDATTADRISRYEKLMTIRDRSKNEQEELEELRSVVKVDLLRGPLARQLAGFKEELIESRRVTD